MIKQDPTCDPKTWLDSMTMYNINVHHNYIHDVEGEGFYIGNSFWQGGMTRSCGGQNIIVYPHRILGLEVHHNIVRNTGWDGIQYGCSPDAQVHDNTIENTGLKKITQQNSGAQIGGGSGGRFYNNILRNSGSTGLCIVGFTDTTRIYNNLFVNAVDGVFADTRDSIKLPKIELQVYNNTFINISSNAMKIYDGGHQYKNAANQWVFFPKSYQPRVKNNIIIGPYFDVKLSLKDPFITLDSSNNYKLKTPFANASMNYFSTEKLALFQDTISYQLKTGSYLIDKGTNYVSNCVQNDILGVPRPQGAFYDIGAYEYEDVPSMQSLVVNSKGLSAFSIYPSVVSDILSVDLPQVSPNAELIIFNIMGKIQTRHALTNGKSPQRINLSVNELPQGYYICSLIDNKEITSLKFVKQ